MNLENVIFLSSNLNRNLDLNDENDFKLLEKIKRKCSYNYNSIDGVNDVLIVDYAEHYTELLKSVLFRDLDKISDDIIGSKVNGQIKLGALSSINSNLFPVMYLYHFILSVGKANGSFPLSNDDYNEDIANKFKNMKVSELIDFNQSQLVKSRILTPLFLSSKQVNRIEGDVSQVSGYTTRDEIQSLCRSYGVSEFLANSFLTTLLEDLDDMEIKDLFAPDNFKNAIDNFLTKINYYWDYLFLIDNFQTNILKSSTNNFANFKTLIEASLTVNKLNFEIPMSYTKDSHYSTRSNGNSWNESLHRSRHYIRNSSSVKTLIVINAPLTHDMLKGSYFNNGNNCSLYLFKVEVLENADLSMDKMFKNSKVRGFEIDNNSRYITYSSNYKAYYPFDFIFNTYKDDEGNHFFDTFQNKIGKIINKLSYVSNFASNINNDNNLNSNSCSLLIDSVAINDIYALQYRFYNKGIMKLSDKQTLISLKSQSSLPLAKFSYFDMSNEDPNSILDSFIDDNIDVYIDYTKVDLNIQSKMNSYKKSNIGYLVKFEDLKDIETITNDFKKKVLISQGINIAFVIRYQTNYELDYIIRIISLLRHEYIKVSIILETNTIYDFNLSKLLITAIYKNSNFDRIDFPIYCTYRNSYTSIPTIDDVPDPSHIFDSE